MNGNQQITVNVKLHVDTDTAMQALNIINIWLSEDPRRQIEIEQFDDGTWRNSLIDADQREEEEQ